MFILGCKVAQNGFHNLSFSFNLISYDSRQVGKDCIGKKDIKSSDSNGGNPSLNHFSKFKQLEIQ